MGKNVFLWKIKNSVEKKVDKLLLKDFIRTTKVLKNRILKTKGKFICVFVAVRETHSFLALFFAFFLIFSRSAALPTFHFYGTFGGSILFLWRFYLHFQSSLFSFLINRWKNIFVWAHKF